MKKIAFILIFVLILSGMATLLQKPVFASTPNLGLTAEAAILIDAKTGQILFEKNAHVLLEPASTTKIMTCLLALEHLELDQIIEIDAISPYTGGSRIFLIEGELITVEQLLMALMLNSANDASVALAIAIAGSVEEFAVMMNDRARELGARNPSYENPSGLHGPNHFATAYDLAVVSRFAMQNPDFRRIVRTVRYTIPETNKQEERNYLFNTNRMLHDFQSRISVRGILTPPYYHGTTGIKTGFTPQAGGTLVASALREGTELIAVVLGSTVDARFADSIILLDFGFENFFTHQAVDASVQIEDVQIRRGEFNHVSVKIKEDKYITLPREASPALVTTQIEIYENIVAPIEIGQVLGRVNVFEGNLLAGYVPIVATVEIAQGMFLSRFGIEDSITRIIIIVAIILGIIIGFLLLAFIVLKIRYTLRRKAKKRARAMEIALERAAKEREQKERGWEY